MPTNLTALIRQRLREGIDHNSILMEVRSNSPKPLNWKLGDITRIATSMNLVVAPVTTRTTSAPASMPDSTQEFEFDPLHSFGIELELTCRLPSEQLARKLTDAGIPTHDTSYNHNDSRTHWKITTDATVHADPGTVGYYPMELVSPILKGNNAIEQIKKVCEVLDQARCKVNSSCGFHVHHEATTSLGAKTYKMTGFAALVYSKFQHEFSAMLPTSRRDQYYAKPVSSSEIRTLLSEGQIGSRYKVVNPEAYTRHGTVEFRQHSGTVNFEKIINWVKLTQAVMARARSLESFYTAEGVTSHGFKSMDEELKLCDSLKNYVRERTEFFRRAA